MNKKWKAKWVKALRSGKYVQVRDALCAELDRGDVGYCCLGVLRHLMHPKSVLQMEDDNLLHQRHEAKAGLTTAQQITLATMNDDGKSFNEIAACIERWL